MRIVIQDSAGKAYLNGQAWTAEADQAQEFETVAQAETYCREQNVRQAMIVLKFSDATREDIRYPIGPRDALLVSRPPTTKIRSLA